MSSLKHALRFGLLVVTPLVALSAGCVPADSAGGGGTGGASASTGGASASTGGAPGTGGTPGGSGGVTGTGGSSAGSGGAVIVPGTGGVETPAATGGRTGTGGTTSGSGGAGVGGSPAGRGGVTSGGGAPPVGTFSRPTGKIPNAPQPASTVNLPKTDWQKGLISPTLLAGKGLAQPTVVNGYLVIAGNEEFWFYDVSNPTMPRQLATVSTPGRRAGGEAESHTVSYGRIGNNLYMVTLSGTGIDTWDVTNTSAPKHVGQIKIAGTNYGDYTEAIWGVAWQGQYIYVGATNNGIKVVDATDPAALKLAGEIPTSQYGGVSGGPLDAIGNVLVVTTPKENGGIATLDISDPVKPVRLASITAPKAYIGMFHRRYVFMIGVSAWDVLTNPRSISTSPMGQLSTGGAEYMSFQDDMMFLGMVRGEIGGTPGATKINVTDPRSMRIVSNIWGRQNLANKNDDQFTIALGNLLVIADDQAPYHGWVIGVHQAEPDTKAPIVDTVIPNNQSTGASTKSRIGITFSDNIEIATVNTASFTVRPMGGQPLPGRYGVRMGVVNFDPDQDLQPGTTYEVVLAKGGLADLAGNAMAAEFRSTFTTN